MKAYAILIEDRHIDVDVELFYDREAAITRARAIVEEYVTDPEDIVEIAVTKHQIDAGWIFYCIYSCEDDRVRILEREVQAPPHAIILCQSLLFESPAGVDSPQTCPDSLECSGPGEHSS